MKRPVTAKAPRAVQAKVYVQHQGVVEVQEQVLAVCFGGYQGVAVQQGRSRAEPALRAGDGEAFCP